MIKTDAKWQIKSKNAVGEKKKEKENKKENTTQ